MKKIKEKEEQNAAHAKEKNSSMGPKDTEEVWRIYWDCFANMNVN